MQDMRALQQAWASPTFRGFAGTEIGDFTAVKMSTDQFAGIGESYLASVFDLVKQSSEALDAAEDYKEVFLDFMRVEEENDNSIRDFWPHRDNSGKIETIGSIIFRR